MVLRVLTEALRFREDASMATANIMIQSLSVERLPANNYKKSPAGLTTSLALARLPAETEKMKDAVSFSYSGHPPHIVLDPSWLDVRKPRTT